MEQERTSPSQGILPAPFRNLELFSTWVLAKESERIRKRLSSPMEELRALYDAMLPQMETIVSYLNQFSLERMPEEAQRLFLLTLSFVEVTSAIELYGQPEVRNGLDDPTRFCPVE
jgi:hypothetical protein